MGKRLITGIDIGMHSICAATFNTNKEKIINISLREVLSPHPLLFANNLFNYREIVKKLQELKRELPRFSTKVALSIPNNFISERVLYLNSELTDRERQYAIEQSLFEVQPLSEEELSIDFVQMEQEKPISSSSVAYQIYSVAKHLVQEREKCCQSVGLVPVVIKGENHALLRLWQIASQQTVPSQGHLLLYIGPHTTTLCGYFSKGLASYKTLAIGAFHSIDSGVMNFAKQISDWIKKEAKGQQIWLCGYGAKDVKLSCLFRDELQVRCTPLVEQSLPQLPKYSHGFEKAIALAVSGHHWTKKHDNS